VDFPSLRHLFKECVQVFHKDGEPIKADAVTHIRDVTQDKRIFFSPAGAMIMDAFTIYHLIVFYPVGKHRVPFRVKAAN
jgi:hypothetical protein